MNGPPTEQRDFLHEVRQVLYGGPGEPGLVWVVKQNSEAIRSIREILYGVGGKPNGGLIDVVRDNKQFRIKFERVAFWFLALAGATLLAEIGRIILWAIGQMA